LLHVFDLVSFFSLDEPPTVSLQLFCKPVLL
jgi:hypothetical protein